MISAVHDVLTGVEDADTALVLLELDPCVHLLRAGIAVACGFVSQLRVSCAHARQVLRDRVR